MGFQKKTYLIFLVVIGSFFSLVWGTLRNQSLSGDASNDMNKKKIVYDMYADYKKNFPHVVDISPKDAMELIRNHKAVFVDTRQLEEMRVSMLPDAVSREQFLSNPQRYSDKTLIGYCTISYRSGKFVEKMAKNGLQFLNLKGGILAWVLEGGKIYDAKGETKRIHVYGKKWNYPASGYEPVW
jgi:sodium/bile acid cotransporter 7